MQSVGGQATIRFGQSAVCLLSAVPAPGFTVSTAQSGTRTMIVTFSGSNHKSQITASIDPDANTMTRETSW